MRSIRITYPTRDAAKPVTIEMEPSQYYDPLESDTGSYEMAGVPRHTAPHRYVPVHPDELKLLIVTEPQLSGLRELRIQYLDGLRSHCIHSIWPDGTEELIHSTDLSDDMYHIIRTQKDQHGYWSVVLNTIGHNYDDLPAVDRLGRYNWGQLQNFWRDVREQNAK